ncbi:hypothetical protein CGCF413_v014251 [Colletotrichum fructicola]|nr:hypothetical protein CGCF413_v014251 [Colletotrichum fructicola]
MLGPDPVWTVHCAWRRGDYGELPRPLSKQPPTLLKLACLVLASRASDNGGGELVVVVVMGGGSVSPRIDFPRLRRVNASIGTGSKPVSVKSRIPEGAATCWGSIEYSSLIVPGVPKVLLIRHPPDCLLGELSDI